MTTILPWLPLIGKLIRSSVMTAGILALLGSVMSRGYRLEMEKVRKRFSSGWTMELDALQAKKNFWRIPLWISFVLIFADLFVIALMIYIIG